MLLGSAAGPVTHVNPVPYVAVVPSKREGEAAFCRIVAKLSFEQADDLDSEVQTVVNFLSTR